MKIFNDIEFAYISKYEILFASLIRNKFSKIDEKMFIDFINDSLGDLKLKDLIISSIFDKAKISSKIMLETDKFYLYTYSKFVKSLCKLKSYDVIDALETYLIKNNESDLLFVLLSEKIKANISIENAIETFTYYIARFSYTYETLNKFLKTISKDHQFLLKLFLKEEGILNLKTYIQTIAKSDINILDDLIPIIVSSFQRNHNHYYELISIILHYTNKYFHQMMTKQYSISVFEGSIFLSNSFSNEAVINYCDYLQSINESSFRTFESKFITKSNGLKVLNYVLNYENADKRAGLLKLLSLEDNSYAILFIKNFPKYKNLMPML